MLTENQGLPKLFKKPKKMYQLFVIMGNKYWEYKGKFA